MNAFIQASQIEKQAEAILLPYMQSVWQDCVYYATRHHALVQKFDGDFLVKRCGNAKYIEIKAEQKTTGNLFLETWSNKQRQTPGWLYSCLADFLWYYFLDSRLLCVAQMPTLRDWASQRIAVFPERKQNCYQQPNDTWGRIVPIAILQRECTGFITGTVPEITA